MVRLIASILSALVLSTAVLSAPTAPMQPEAPAPEPAMVSTSSSAMMHETTTTTQAKHEMTTTTSAAMAHETTTSTAMVHQTTTTSAAMAHETTTSAAMVHETTTSTAAAQPTAVYGSGYANWGTDLNSCVQMCQAKFGAPSAAPPPAEATPPTATAPAGTGATHTVIVAPTKGVLRYVPFAVNASVGDTVRFMWGAGPHTVTKSSALTVCNKSADASAFASGMQNASFVFDQVVNTTEPTFFYCAVPNHCAKGMFGIVNPPTVPVEAATSVAAMIPTWKSENPEMAKVQEAVDKITIKTPAYNWASNIDASALPVESHAELFNNIMYSRMFYAQNTGAEQGAARPDGQPVVIPSDISVLLSNTAGNPAGAGGAPAGAAPSGTPTGTAAPATSPTGAANGAKGLVASSALIAGIAALSSVFLF